MVKVVDNTGGFFSSFDPPTVPKIGRPEVRVAFGATLLDGRYRISVAGTNIWPGLPWVISPIASDSAGFSIDRGQSYGVSDFGQVAFRVTQPTVYEIWRGDMSGGIINIDWAPVSGGPAYGPVAINMLGGVAFIKTTTTGSSTRSSELWLSDFRGVARAVLTTGDRVFGAPVSESWGDQIIHGFNGFEPMLDDMNRVAAIGGVNGGAFSGILMPRRVGSGEERSGVNMIFESVGGSCKHTGKIGVRGQVAYNLTKRDSTTQIVLSDGRTARDRSSGLAALFNPNQMLIGGIDRNGTVVYYHEAGLAAFAHDGTTLTTIANTSAPIVPGITLSLIHHVTTNRTGAWSLLGSYGAGNKAIFVGRRSVPMMRLFGTGDSLDGSRIQDFRVVHPNLTNASYLGERSGTNHLAFAYDLEDGRRGIEYLDFVV